MKNRFRILLAILAIVVSFILIFDIGAAAEIEMFTGTAVSVSNRTIALDTNDDGIADVIVTHMGPAWFWGGERGISYPEKGAELAIDAYDSYENGYVAVAVCYSDPINIPVCIQLRDPDTLKPIWPPVGMTDVQSGGAAEAIDDVGSDLPCLENCDPIEYDYDYSYDQQHSQPGPHGNSARP